jgi:cytoskeletal protein CcmA (bactofilin family)
MKHPFIKKIMTLLEKEVCQEELCKEVFSSHLFKPLNFDKKETLEKNQATAKSSPQETILAEGVMVKGELRFDKQLRINGSFEGSLQTQGKVIVGSTGSIKGDIVLDEAEIHGSVIGNIRVRKLFVAASAQIHGNIYAQSVDFQKGAKLVGQITIENGEKVAVFEEEALLHIS